MALFSLDSGINHLQQGPKWVKLETVVDSGAAWSVACVEIGQTYPSTSGAKLPKMGDKKFDMVTPEGHWAQATFQVAEATGPL